MIIRCLWGYGLIQCTISCSNYCIGGFAMNVLGNFDSCNRSEYIAECLHVRTNDVSDLAIDGHVGEWPQNLCWQWCEHVSTCTSVSWQSSTSTCYVHLRAPMLVHSDPGFVYYEKQSCVDLGRFLLYLDHHSANFKWEISVRLFCMQKNAFHFRCYVTFNFV